MEDYARCLLALLNDAGLLRLLTSSACPGAARSCSSSIVCLPQHVRSMIIADSYAGWTGSLGAEDAQARLDRSMRESQLPAADWVPQWVPGAFSAGARQEVLDELASDHVGLPSGGLPRDVSRRASRLLRSTQRHIGTGAPDLGRR